LDGDKVAICSAGRYFSALEQQASCDSCPYGQWQDLEGQSTCKKCFAGKISKRTKQTSNETCENCGKYTYPYKYILLDYYVCTYVCTHALYLC
jgi:hypothetical protein